jgi:small basic protein
MTKPVLGVVVGAVLGLLDGLSAWFSPDARPIFVSIVIGSTLKGVVTGLLAGLIGRWKQSTLLGVVAGLLIGLALSSLAALGQPGHYLEIVLPGMVVGALVGFVTQRYPSDSGVRSSRTRIGGLALTAMLLPAHAPALPQQPPANDGLERVDRRVRLIQDPARRQQEAAQWRPSCNIPSLLGQLRSNRAAGERRVVNVHVVVLRILADCLD